jgi:hypothetical protein
MTDPFGTLLFLLFDTLSPELLLERVVAMVLEQEQESPSWWPAPIQVSLAAESRPSLVACVARD